jgi:3-phenylpropionate/trans-cinnamate dioxygenase ferredoxin reductase component
MADRVVDVLLVGGGVASARCAEELRARGFSGSVLLAGRELDPPYARPPATKGHLAGRTTLDDALVLPEAWYGEHGVDLSTRTSVTKLDLEAREATLATKETVAFGHALLATGANVRRLPVDGAELDGLHYLRTLRNADALRADVADAERVVMVGGSYVGCEAAATLADQGKACTILMLESTTLEQHFGARAGAAVQRRLEERGVRCVGEAEVVRFEGEDRVARVVCADGRTFDADAVVVGIGAVPDAVLARGAGLTPGESGGVRCSSRLETSAAGVYAAGDVCEYESVVHGRALRVEHYHHASAQGRTVARNIAGEAIDHDEIPYFWSDLGDWLTLESVGPAVDGWDEEVVRGSLDDDEWTVFYLREGRLAAALTAGRPDDLDEARQLLRSREPVDASALAGV